MKMRLSIIIPCYNCASTLTEAVDSCFKQNLDPQTFEIIMVDDGSTDTTRDVMVTLGSSYHNVKLLYHSENRGGGATRNTGIKASNGEVIFCLDSDNFFAPHSVDNILQVLEEKKLDGVAYHERRYFEGNQHSKYHTHVNTKLDTEITIQDIFSIKNHILLDNFFYTRVAYDSTAGYPEHHGFDTQCFELRFLAAGNQVHVALGSVFYHRQDRNHNSYFQRVYKQGHFSRNLYLIYEDIMYLFSYETRHIIMEFDIFGKSKLDAHNLKATLDQHLQANPNKFLIPEYKKYLNPAGQTNWINDFRYSETNEDIFAQAILHYRLNNYSEASAAYSRLLQKGIDTPIVYFNILRLSLAMTNKYNKRNIEDRVQELAINLQPRKQSLNRFTNLISNVLNTLYLPRL